MRIAWFSNAPWAPSGYGVQTRMVVPRIRSLGHEVFFFSNCGLQGGILGWDGMTVIPMGFNNGIDPNYLRSLMAGNKIDACITFFDAWSLASEAFHPAKWIPWYPVDRDPFPAAVKSTVQKAPYSISCSEWGQKKAEEAGLHSSYTPCAVDTKVFYPIERQVARDNLGIDQEDIFIVGIVADNKGNPCRKALLQQIQAFAEYRKDNMHLYVHTCVDASRGGQPLGPLVHHLGIQKFVHFPDQVRYQMGGFDDDYMRNIYNSFNVLSAVSMDEGFGVPIIEAQACGTPVVAGDWTAMSELVGAGALVPESRAERWWNPTGGFQFLPQVKGIANTFRCFLGELAVLGEEGMRKRARDFALQYDIETVFDKFWKYELKMIEDVCQRPSQ